MSQIDAVEGGDSRSRASGKSRARKKHSSKRWSGRSWRGLPKRFLNSLRSSALLCAIPLLLILTISSTDFLIATHIADTSDSLFFAELPEPSDDPRRDAAELQKADLLQYVYLFLFLVCAIHWREVSGYFLKWRHLSLIVLYLFVGVFISVEPAKVVTNSLLILIGFLASVLFASAYTRPGYYDSFYAVVFWPMVLLHAGSLFVLTLYDVDMFDLLLSSQRYGGLAGNPNSLGSLAVLGVWAATSMLLSPNSGRGVRAVAVLGLILFLFNTALSGSGTSIVAVIVIVLALIWLRVLAAFKPRTRLIVNASLAILAALVFLYSLLFTTPAELYLSITGSLGKDATLTGRTELWAIASEAISQKPWLGWGFDSHQSVMTERAFEVPFNHYHNGFLDTMVAGGVVLLTLVLYNIFRFSQIFLRTFRKQRSVFPLLLPLIILVVLNLSEYSLLRPNSQHWLIYMIAFAMLTYDPIADVSLRIKVGDKGRRGSGRRRRGTKLRWA